MSYKPQKINTSQYRKGVGKVRFGKNKETKEFTGKVYILFDNETDPVIVRRDDCPKYIQEGEFYINMEKNDEGIRSTTPLDGLFWMKFKEFVHREDELPEPKSRVDKYNRTVEEFDFYLEIADGDYAGMPVFMRLPYWFMAVKEGDKVVVGIESHPKSPRMGVFEDWCEAVGIWERGAIPWPDSGNVLPRLQKIINSLPPKKFQVLLKDGFVNLIYPQGEAIDRTSAKSDEFDDFTPNIEPPLDAEKVPWEEDESEPEEEKETEFSFDDEDVSF